MVLGRKTMKDLDSILKSRDITLPTKIHIVKLDHKEGWAPKNWCFWTVVLDKILESALDCKQIKSVNSKGNQSWILIGGLNIHCWSWSSNTLATWCKEQTHWKRPWCWERLKAGGEGVDRGWDGWIVITNLMDWSLSSSMSQWWTEKPGMLQSLVSQSWTQLSNWTTTTCCLHCFGALNNIVILDSYYTVSEQTINETIQSIFSAHYGIITSSFRLPRWH